MPDAWIEIFDRVFSPGLMRSMAPATTRRDNYAAAAAYLRNENQAGSIPLLHYIVRGWKISWRKTTFGAVQTRVSKNEPDRALVDRVFGAELRRALEASDPNPVCLLMGHSSPQHVRIATLNVFVHSDHAEGPPVSLAATRLLMKYGVTANTATYHYVAVRRPVGSNCSVYFGGTALADACYSGNVAAVRELLTDPDVDPNLTTMLTNVDRMVRTSMLDGRHYLTGAEIIPLSMVDMAGAHLVSGMITALCTTPLIALLIGAILKKKGESSHVDHAACLDLLRAAPGFNATAVDQNGTNAIMVAARSHNVGFLKILLDLGFKTYKFPPMMALNTGDRRGHTALMKACSGAVTIHKRPAVETVRLLAETKGCLLDTLDYTGSTALHWLARSHDRGAHLLFAVLIAAGADVNVIGADGRTPLAVLCTKLRSDRELRSIKMLATSPMVDINRMVGTKAASAGYLMPQSVVNTLVLAGISRETFNFLVGQSKPRGLGDAIFESRDMFWRRQLHHCYSHKFKEQVKALIQVYYRSRVSETELPRLPYEIWELVAGFLKLN